MNRNFRAKDGGAAENVLYASIRFSELCIAYTGAKLI